MALYFKTKTLLAKIQPTAGTDPVPTNVANGMLVRNLSVRPMNGTDVSRELERNHYGAQAMFPVGLHVVASFEIELIGHATRGTAPAWSAIARACGLAEVVSAGTSVVYNPVSSGHSLVTLYFAHAGFRQIITDCRGTAVLRVNANQIPVMAVTLTGLYQKPTDTAGVVPTVSAFQQPLPVTKTNTPTFTINSVACVMRNFELDFGNVVQPRMLVGAEEVVISDSNEQITTQIEAVPLATFDPYALAAAQTSFAVNLVHGSGSGKIVTINAPTCRMMRPESIANEQNIVEWPLRITPLPNAGNDQFTITLT
jgi:hypothetical protein